MKPLGIFGGTFDPIHYGHLRTAFELLQALDLGEVRFIPCGNPPHRTVALADGRTRMAMLRLAVQGLPGFTVDDRELRRQGPSYSVDTVISLREEFPDRSLCLIIGMDAFLGLPGWHRHDEILQFAHIVVAHRPGWEAPADGPLGELISRHRAQRPDELRAALHGRIYIHAVTQLEIASTEIRDLVAAGRDPRFLMPDTVRNMIMETSCYTRKNLFPKENENV